MTASERIYILLSPLVNDRCYPVLVPEGADSKPPYAVYNLISSMPDNTLDGVTGHEWVSMQIDVYHDDYDELIRLSSLIIQALDTITPSHYEGVSYTTDYDKDERIRLFRAIIEYQFWQTFM